MSFTKQINAHYKVTSTAEYEIPTKGILQVIDVMTDAYSPESIQVFGRLTIDGKDVGTTKSTIFKKKDYPSDWKRESKDSIYLNGWKKNGKYNVEAMKFYSNTWLVSKIFGLQN